MIKSKLGIDPVEAPYKEDTFFEHAVYEKEATINFRKMLDHHKVWDSTSLLGEAETPSILNRNISGRIMVLVDSNGRRLSSQALHESIMWFRGIYRAYSKQFVTDEDLALLWRQIIPFTLSGRYDLITMYFGKTDTYAFTQVCINTYRVLNEEKFFDFPESIKGKFDQSFESDVAEHSKQSCRVSRSS